MDVAAVPGRRKLRHDACLGLSNWLFDHGIAAQRHRAGVDGDELSDAAIRGQQRPAARVDTCRVTRRPRGITNDCRRRCRQNSVAQIAQEARSISRSNEYMPAMMRIDRFDRDRSGQAGVDKFSAFTGLGKDFIERDTISASILANSTRNCCAIRTPHNRPSGQPHSRASTATQPVTRPDGDPSGLNAIRPPYTAAFNSYVRANSAISPTSNITFSAAASRAPGTGTTSTNRLRRHEHADEGRDGQKSVHEDLYRLRILRHGDAVLCR